MPQLDFTWWMMNFLIVWISVMMVLTMLLNSTSPSSIDQTSSMEIKKESTPWQWL